MHQSTVSVGEQFAISGRPRKPRVKTGWGSMRPVDIKAASKSVLVVDDEPMIHRIISQTLRHHGYKIYETSNAAEALAVLQEHPIGVALIDKNLERDSSGLDILRELSKQSAFTKSIIITAYASLDSVIEALRLGAFDYVRKPFTLDVLEDKVRRAFAALHDDIRRSETVSREEALFDTIPGLLWFATRDGVVQRVNGSGAKLLGYADDELIGCAYDVLLAEDQGDPADQWAFKERRTGDRATRGERVMLKTSSGHVRPFEVYSTGVYERVPGEERRHFWGTVGVAQAVGQSETFRIEFGQSERMEALERFARSVAHDFRNILSVISSSAGMAREELPAEHAVLPEIDLIEQATEQAAELTSHLQTFGRTEARSAGRVDLTRELTRMAPMLERIVARSVKLQLSVPPERCMIGIERHQISQIMLNLAANASDAMPQGGELEVTIRRELVPPEYAEDRKGLEPGLYNVLTVSDTGLGMPPDVMAHIFEPFFTTKAVGQGTGLGLATVHGIVKSNGGYISVDSRPGAGTRFRVYFPVA